MGKHKHKKDKKKHKKNKKKYHTSSSSEEEWVEKKVNSESSDEEKMEQKRKHKNTEFDEPSEDDHVNKKLCNVSTVDKITNMKRDYLSTDNEDSKRDEWMSLSSFCSTSNSDRKQKRTEQKNLERQKQQYNPRECSRELNPYWKDGGDGLPKFKKPTDSGDEYTKSYYNKYSHDSKITPKWKKKGTQEEQTLSRNESVDLINNTEQKGLSGTTEENILSEKELNLLAAKLVKAEIMGNTKLIKELKEKLENARNIQRHSNHKNQLNEEDILLTHTDSQGHSKPVTSISDQGGSSGSYQRKKNIETHSDGQRVRYFADDDKYSLKQMFEIEKYQSVDHQNREFVKMAGNIRKNDDMDDIFSDNIRKKESDEKIDIRNRTRAINESERISKSLDNCNKCIQSEIMLKHLMISLKETNYIAVPPYEPLTKGHCFIVPIRHVPCSTQLDENEWSEILNIRKLLVNLFKSTGSDVIFFETAMLLHRFPHMYIECVPLPKESGDLAPIYFKKAIDESETEWTQNKKLVPLKGRDVRKAIPKGLPYFTVSFGMDEGFAHVIEDERLFPSNFAQEIVGGILDLHHSKWRKPKIQSFEDQSKRVLEFSKEWKTVDSTI